jgi:hypothetical protein
MQILIEQGSKVNTKSGTSKQGKAYSFREQEAYLLGMGKFPVMCSVPVPDDSRDGYAPGTYDVTQPLVVGSYGRLMVSRDLQLVPARKAAAA